MIPALQAMHAKARDPGPVRRAKIAAARRGKPRPAHVVAAMRQRQLGKRPSKATRAKMSEAHRRRGTRPQWLNAGWSAAEDELCRSLPPHEVAKRTGRTLPAVYSRRSQLAVNDGRTRRHA
jgi:hypothetical protein